MLGKFEVEAQPILILCPTALSCDYTVWVFNNDIDLAECKARPFSDYRYILKQHTFCISFQFSQVVQMAYKFIIQVIEFNTLFRILPTDEVGGYDLLCNGSTLTSQRSYQGLHLLIVDSSLPKQARGCCFGICGNP
ncbi:hypothetical protein ABID99_003571 [Mucilaginibacter sp. OAE612]